MLLPTASLRPWIVAYLIKPITCPTPVPKISPRFHSHGFSAQGPDFSAHSAKLRSPHTSHLKLPQKWGPLYRWLTRRWQRSIVWPQTCPNQVTSLRKAQWQVLQLWQQARGLSRQSEVLELRVQPVPSTTTALASLWHGLHPVLGGRAWPFFVVFLHLKACGSRFF